MCRAIGKNVPLKQKEDYLLLRVLALLKIICYWGCWLGLSKDPIIAGHGILLVLFKGITLRSIIQCTNAECCLNYFKLMLLGKITFYKRLYHMYFHCIVPLKNASFFIRDLYEVLGDCYCLANKNSFSPLSMHELIEEKSRTEPPPPSPQHTHTPYINHILRVFYNIQTWPDQNKIHILSICSCLQVLMFCIT